MLISKSLVSILSATAATALPNVGGQLRETRCVHGSPKKYDKWTINYEEAKLPSKDRKNGYVLDPVWVARHETVGDSSHFSAGSSWIPWGENKCQYICNARKGCVSFVGYETQRATPDNGDLYCHFFDAIISSGNIISRPANGAYKMTHAYNKLCDSKSII